jgi:thioredoxin 1
MAEHVFTDSNFESDVLGESLPVLVDFWAPWCGPCQQMGPIVEAISTEFTGKAVVGKLNVDENQATAGKYNVMSIPTFLVFRNGEVVDQMVGGTTGEKLKELVEKHI